MTKTDNPSAAMRGRDHPLFEGMSTGRENPDPLWSLLRGHGYLWHRTSLAALRGILTDHEITPNQGQFPSTFPQSDASYGRYMGAVSLFDFDTASEADFEAHRTDYWHGDVFIRIRRDALHSDRLRSVDDVWRDPRLDGLTDDDKSKLARVPYLEVLYDGPVPETAFKGVIFLPDSEGYSWHETTSDAAGLCELSKIAERWKAEHERQVAERHARGEYTHKENVLLALGKREEQQAAQPLVIDATPVEIEGEADPQTVSPDGK